VFQPFGQYAQDESFYPSNRFLTLLPISKSAGNGRHFCDPTIVRFLLNFDCHQSAL
jgi:hypothetical protein